MSQENKCLQHVRKVIVSSIVAWMDQEEFHRMLLLSQNLVEADQKKNSSSLEVNNCSAPLTYITRSYQI